MLAVAEEPDLFLLLFVINSNQSSISPRQQRAYFDPIWISLPFNNTLHTWHGCKVYDFYTPPSTPTTACQRNGLLTEPAELSTPPPPHEDEYIYICAHKSRRTGEKMLSEKLHIDYWFKMGWIKNKTKRKSRKQKQNQRKNKTPTIQNKWKKPPKKQTMFKRTD